MKKPNGINQRSWDRAGELFAQDTTNLAFIQPDGGKIFQSSIALAFMKFCAEQRETDAKHIDAGISYLAQAALDKPLKGRNLEAVNIICGAMKAIADAIRNPKPEV